MRQTYRTRPRKYVRHAGKSYLHSLAAVPATIDCRRSSRSAASGFSGSTRGVSQRQLLLTPSVAHTLRNLSRMRGDKSAPTGRRIPHAFTFSTNERNTPPLPAPTSSSSSSERVFRQADSLQHSVARRAKKMTASSTTRFLLQSVCHTELAHIQGEQTAP